MTDAVFVNFLFQLDVKAVKCESRSSLRQYSRKKLSLEPKVENDDREKTFQLDHSFTAVYKTTLFLISQFKTT